MACLIALVACGKTTGGTQLSVGAGPTKPILVGTTGEVVIASDAVTEGLPGGPQFLYPDLSRVEVKPSGIFKAHVEDHVVILEATGPGEATIKVWGRANEHESTLTFQAQAENPLGFGYRIYAGPNPGFLDIEAGEIRLAAAMRYRVLPYLRRAGRGLESGEIANADIAGDVLYRDPDRKDRTPGLYDWRLSSDSERTIALPQLGLPGATHVMFVEPIVTIEWAPYGDGWWKGEFRALGSDGAVIKLPSASDLSGTWTITTPQSCGGADYHGSGIADVRLGDGPRSGRLEYGHVLLSKRPGAGNAACAVRVELQRTGRPPVTVIGNLGS